VRLPSAATRLFAVGYLRKEPEDEAGELHPPDQAFFIAPGGTVDPATMCGGYCQMAGPSPALRIKSGREHLASRLPALPLLFHHRRRGLHFSPALLPKSPEM